MTPLLALNGAGIYGQNITRLHKVCGENPHTMLAVLRAESLGLISKEKIDEAIANQGKEGMPTLNTNLMVQVLDALPSFSFPVAATGSDVPLTQGMDTPLPEIPDTSKIPRVAGHQPDQGQEKKQGGKQ